ncbi:hypothetical protein GEMRC1_009977 [Eukaryota sp. GEM-RC1]
MHKCSFTDDAFELFCDLIRTSTSLTSLDLSNCNLYESDLLRIIEFNRHISSFNFRGLKFGRQLSVKALADLLKVNTTLSKIDLWGNSICNEGALELLKILELNSTIECINLGNNGFKKRTKTEIKTISNGRIVFLTN